MSTGPACVCGRRKSCPKACPSRRLAKYRDAPEVTAEATAAPVITDPIDAQPVIERYAQAHGWDFSPYDYNPNPNER